MYLSLRGMIIRNGATAIVNGAITLIILLIAPLGLATVIFLTLMVTISTFSVCSLGDMVTSWLLPSGDTDTLSPGQGIPIRQIDPKKQLERQDWD